MSKPKQLFHFMKLLFAQFLIVFSTAYTFGQSRVVNFGSPNQNTICSDGYIDESGNSIALMWNAQSGFMIGSFDRYFNSNWLVSFGVSSGTAGKLIKLTSGDFLGYILQDPNGKGHVFKFSSAGTIFWHKQFDMTSNISECLELANQNIAIIANYGATSSVIVFDPNGTPLFSKSLSDGNNGQFYFRDIIQTEYNNQLIIGDCIDSSHPQRLVLVKVDDNLDPIWSKSFEYSGITNNIRNAIQDVSGNFYLVGSSRIVNSASYNDYDLSILKFDSLGNYLLGKSYGSEYQDGANDIIGGNLNKSFNGTFTIIGNSKPVEVCGDNLLVVSINSDLDTIFTKHYGHPAGSGTSYSELHSINDSIYTFGSYSLWSNIGVSDGHLIKTDPSFELACEYYKSGLELNANIDLVEITNPFNFSNTTVSMIDYLTTTASNIIVTDACHGTLLENIENSRIQFQVIPNPVDSELNLMSESNFDIIVIFDMLGNKVVEIENVMSNSFLMNLSDLSKGTYVIEIKSASKIGRQKLIVD
ncbi:MAG: T9SS type A sorting domain-containing protein [Fluviicola sp.]